VDAGIHSVQQVVLGAVLAVFLTASVYWVMPHVREFLTRNANQQRPAAPSAAVPSGAALAGVTVSAAGYGGRLGSSGGNGGRP
jgi:membrane-associated phospholipid phosphatase